MENEKRLTFRLLFYIKPAGANADRGRLMLRVCIDGAHADLSLYTTVEKAAWRPGERRFENCEGAERLNMLINDVQARARHVFFTRMLDGSRPTAAEVRDALQCRTCRTGLLAFARQHNADFGKWVGRERSASSLKKYRMLVVHLSQYVAAARHAADVPLAAVDEDFARGFVRFLSDRLCLAPGTVRLYVTAVRHIMGLARRRGLISTDPFAALHLPTAMPQCEYLTPAELEALKRLETGGLYGHVRNLFLLSCYTGLAYADLVRLRAEHVERDATGECWITKPREKNGRCAMVCLVPAAVELLGRLRTNRSDALLDVPDNRTCNRYLKVLASHAGICRRLHFHMARHTFATLLLTAGVPIESVSLMLGHSRITTTQIYAQVTRNKIAREAECMSRAFGV